MYVFIYEVSKTRKFECGITCTFKSVKNIFARSFLIMASCVYLLKVEIIRSFRYKKCSFSFGFKYQRSLNLN